MIDVFMIDGNYSDSIIEPFQVRNYFQLFDKSWWPQFSVAILVWKFVNLSSTIDNPFPLKMCFQIVEAIKMTNTNTPVLVVCN